MSCWSNGHFDVPCVEITGQWSAFDPTGLERAAKAVRELDSSRECSRSVCVTFCKWFLVCKCTCLCSYV